MKGFLGLVILIAAAYFFRNYQAFGEQNLRPWAVQLNYDREGDPQALCDQLAPTAQVVIRDDIPRHKVNFTGDKMQACEYFLETAKNFAQPYRSDNGYIPDRIENLEVKDIDFLKGTAEVSFTWASIPAFYDPNQGLKMRKQNIWYIGQSKTTLKLINRPLQDMQITYYEFERKLDTAPNK